MTINLNLGGNDFLNSQEISFDSNVAALGFIADNEKINLTNPINVANLESQNVEKVEFITMEKGEKTHIIGDFQFQSNNNGVAVIIARLYKHNGRWKIRALAEPFDSNASLLKYTEIELFAKTTLQTVASNIQSNVQERVAVIRQNENVQRAEQVLGTTAKIVSETAQIAANGVRQVYTQMMGNSDVIAQQQARNERFQPLDLTRMQSVSFDQVVPPLKNLHLGLGWKSKKGVGLLNSVIRGGTVNVDLDLSVQLLNFYGQVVDNVYYEKIRSDNLAVNHYGDSATGGNGLQDNEIISVALENLPKDVAYIAVTATSNKGHTFNGLESGFFRALNQQAMLPLIQIQLDTTQAKTGCLLGIFSRDRNNEWNFINISDYTDGKKITDLNQIILNWAKIVGQTRGIVPQNADNLLLNRQL